MTWTVAALYKFTPIQDTAALKATLLPLCVENNICGTILLAPEGINGTIAGPSESQLNAIIDFMDEKLGIRSGELKYSPSQHKPFNRMKVRLKKEIITMRAPDADPNKQVGTYVAPEDWNNLINDPDVVLVDTRNEYETRVGIFKGAIDPDIQTFTEFKDYVKNNMNPEKHKKVAMYCTGGIRCEKASSYMLAQGFEEVYHLKGGILKYLETVPTEKSLWDGDCFVFDMRVAVGHGLEEKDWTICFGCREPLSPEDQAHEAYEKGVSCPHCIQDLSPERAAALRMRHEHISTQIEQEDTVK